MNNNEIQGKKYIYFAVNFIFTTIVCEFIWISCCSRLLCSKKKDKREFAKVFESNC
jgi:hypothetical protein